MSVITPIDPLAINTFVCQHAVSEEHDFGTNVTDNFAWEVSPAFENSGEFCSLKFLSILKVDGIICM
jgi:hypothetical protein